MCWMPNHLPRSLSMLRLASCYRTVKLSSKLLSSFQNTLKNKCSDEVYSSHKKHKCESYRFRSTLNSFVAWTQENLSQQQWRRVDNLCIMLHQKPSGSRIMKYSFYLLPFRIYRQVTGSLLTRGRCRRAQSSATSNLCSRPLFPLPAKNFTGMTKHFQRVTISSPQISLSNIICLTGPASNKISSTTCWRWTNKKSS